GCAGKRAGDERLRSPAAGAARLWPAARGMEIDDHRASGRDAASALEAGGASRGSAPAPPGRRVKPVDAGDGGEPGPSVARNHQRDNQIGGRKAARHFYPSVWRDGRLAARTVAAGGLEPRWTGRCQSQGTDGRVVALSAGSGTAHSSLA